MSDELTRLTLLANVASTLFMVGLIWFVQVVHYPLFARVDPECFREYEEAHVRTTTWVVCLPMIVEVVTSLILVWQPPRPELVSLCWVGLGLVIVIWISTAFLQVPRHNILATRFDAAAHRALVGTNWIRSLAWSLRAGLVLIMVWQLLQTGIQPEASGATSVGRQVHASAD